MSEEIVWKDPPPLSKYGAHGIWERRLAPLVERPGEWAVVKETAKTNTSIAAQLRRRVYRIPFPSHEWEFVQRSSDHNTIEIYARYLGPKEDKS